MTFDDSTQIDFKIAYEIIDGQIARQMLRSDDSEKERAEAIAHSLAAALEHQLSEMVEGDRKALDDFMELKEYCDRAVARWSDSVQRMQERLDHVRTSSQLLGLLLMDIMQEKGCKRLETACGVIERKTDHRS